MLIKTSRLWNVSFELNVTYYQQDLYYEKSLGIIGESLLTFFASLTYAHHHLLKLIK